MRDDDAKVFDRRLVKETLFRFEVEVEMEEAVKDFVSESLKLLEVRVEEEDVIEVDNKMTLVDEVLEDVSHERLKGGRGIAKAKGHDKWFKEAEVALKGGFPFVTGFDTNVVITPVDIEFRKIMRRLKFVYKVWNKGEQEGIFYRDIIELSVILDRS